jgi:hypothetical protein
MAVLKRGSSKPARDLSTILWLSVTGGDVQGLDSESSFPYLSIVVVVQMRKLVDY